MKQPVRKLHSAAGISRFVAILLVLVAVMLVAVAVPFVSFYAGHTADYYCKVAMDKAQREITVGYLDSFGGQDKDGAAKLIRADQYTDELCPSGGDCYIVERETGGMPYTVVCALHDDDTKERVRLNAGAALLALREALRSRQLLGEQTPDELTITLNSREITAVRVEEDPGLRRGTASTTGLEGTVLYYAVGGACTFVPGAPQGSICYLGYADENHAAVWTSAVGWTGDSYAK